MSDVNAITKRAFDLLGHQPEGGGLTLDVVGGEDDLVFAQPDPIGLLAQAGVFRFPETRPAIELNVYAQCKGGKISVGVHRVTGMAHLETIPDPTEGVGFFEASSLDEAASRLADVLKGAVPEGTELRIGRLFYRNDSVASCDFSADRADAESFKWIRQQRGTADIELTRFVEGVVDKAMAWGAPNFTPTSLSLWFYPDPKEISAVYITITPRGESYTVQTEDRVCWPWKNRKQHHVADVDALKAFVAGYLSKAHAFEFSQMRVYMAYSIAG